MELKLENLTKTYNNKIALDHFTYTFGKGVYGILGPNGAGKSTLLKLITDSIKREFGTIMIKDKDILAMNKEYRHLFGYMAQDQKLYPNMSAWEFLYYVSRLKNIPKKEAKEQINQLFQSLHLEDAAYKKLGGYSGGMMRRILLAQALLGNPQILILDEPTAGLDPKERIRIRNLISELAQDRMVLLSTHVVSDIECIAEQVLLLKQGKLIGTDHTNNLIASIKDKVAEKYCTPDEIITYQNKYGLGNIYQRSEGQLLRLVGDELPKEFTITNDAIGLEDVYLYYFEGKVTQEN